MTAPAGAAAAVPPRSALTPSIDDVLAAARARLLRLTPGESLCALQRSGAVIADIRPDRNRQTEGMVPGSVVVERNVLEWRFDPASRSRLPIARHDLIVIVMCNEGYTSSLAAAALQDIGLWAATDMIGGFRAWRAAGLPVTYDDVDVTIGSDLTRPG